MTTSRVAQPNVSRKIYGRRLEIPEMLQLRLDEVARALIECDTDITAPPSANFRTISQTLTLVSSKPRLLRELGVLLHHIAADADARTVFRQRARKKPKRDAEHQLVALTYWGARARNLTPDDSDALRAVRALLPELRNLAAATIRKIAQKNRKRSLVILGMPFEPLEGGHWEWFDEMPIWRREFTIDLAERAEMVLRQYLRRKSARPHVDTSSRGNHP